MPVVKNYKCPGCGADLKNIHKAEGKCEFCGGSYVIEGLAECQKLTSSEQIVSGMPLKASPKTISDTLVQSLTSSLTAPLDVLQEASITNVEYLCLPCYYYHYNATSDYMCDVANSNIMVSKDSNGQRAEIASVNWSTITGNTRADTENIVSGNENYDTLINILFSPYQKGLLTDAESLEIMPGVVTKKFSLPESALLDKYVRPSLQAALRQSAINQIGGRTYQNLSIGNSNIEKDQQINKVLAGIYHLTVNYKSNLMHFYFRGDGQRFLAKDPLPVDPTRVTQVTELNKKRDSYQSKIKLCSRGVATGAIGALLLFFFKTPIIASFFLALFVVSVIKFREYKPLLAEAEQKIKEFNVEIPNIRDSFLQRNQKISGMEQFF